MFFSRLREPLFDPDEIFADSASSVADAAVDRKIEEPLERVYLWAFLLFVAAGIGYLAFRGAELQLFEGAAFLSRAQDNRFVARSVFPPRGAIYDRFGAALVENIPSFGLAFEKDAFGRSGRALSEFLPRLAEILGVEDEYLYEIGFPRDGDLSVLPSRFVIARNIPVERVVAVYAAADELPGIAVVEGYERRYRDPYATAHLVGFIGRAGDEDLRRSGVAAGEMAGKSGLEAMYDEKLRGASGKKLIEVDSAGRETRFKLAEQPTDGMSLELTVDGDLQRTAYETLASFTQYSKGASVVALDPRDGAVRALVSFPSFDSNKFSSFLRSRDFAAVASNPLKPMFNRAIAGEFPSGSTIKPLIAAAALEEKIVKPTKQIYDVGYIEIPNPYRPGETSVFKDWKAHGLIDLYDAIAYSANVYFYMLGGGFKDQEGLGIERIARYMEQFGFGRALGIDLPGEKPGRIPTPATKAAVDPQNPVWRIGDTYNVSIGQGGFTATPLQVTAMTAAIANGGTLFRPYIVREIKDPGGHTVAALAPAPLRTDIVSRAVIDDVVRGMRRTVTHGTASRLAALPVAAAAKTGTAQAGAGLPHAWVVAFAPAENPTIVLVVMVEHAGEGSTVAMPIAYEILNWYFTHRTAEER